LPPKKLASGQTWFCGSEVIYVSQIRADYRLQCDCCSCCEVAPPKEDADASSSAYLLVDKFWVDTRTLDEAGYRYKDSVAYVFLDPKLSWVCMCPIHPSIHPIGHGGENSS
jgi:hypothetical protein